MYRQKHIDQLIDFDVYLLLNRSKSGDSKVTKNGRKKTRNRCQNLSLTRWSRNRKLGENINLAKIVIVEITSTRLMIRAAFPHRENDILSINFMIEKCLERVTT